MKTDDLLMPKVGSWPIEHVRPESMRSARLTEYDLQEIDGAQVFFGCTGEGEADGGFTRWNKFEPAVGWDLVLSVGDVCPDCKKDFEDMLEAFRRKPPTMKGDLHEP